VLDDTIIEFQSAIKYVAAGGYFTYIVTEDDTVYNCGENNFGQLAVDPSVVKGRARFNRVDLPAKVKLIACGRAFAMIVTSDNQFISVGANGELQLGKDTTEHHSFDTTPFGIKNAYNFVQLSCGHNFALALTHDGQVMFTTNIFEQDTSVPDLGYWSFIDTFGPSGVIVDQIACSMYASAFRASKFISQYSLQQMLIYTSR
jgi:alpha-tubulin suppressor-like RCC1 family protein